MTTKLSAIFRKPRVLLPVIHYAGETEALASIRCARDQGAAGVWLINQGIDTEGLAGFAALVRAKHPGLWLGVNMLGVEPHDALVRLDIAGARVDGLWSDNGGVEFRRLPHLPGVRGPVWRETFVERMNAARGRRPELLYFGGEAFKGRPHVQTVDLASLGREAQWHMDVVTTSGPATGVSADPARVAELARGVQAPAAVGLASGVTPENVRLYLPTVHAFLVASGIEVRDGVLDPAKVRALADAIERGPVVPDDGNGNDPEGDSST